MSWTARSYTAASVMTLACVSVSKQRRSDGFRPTVGWPTDWLTDEAARTANIPTSRPSFVRSLILENLQPESCALMLQTTGTDTAAFHNIKWHEGKMELRILKKTAFTYSSRDTRLHRPDTADCMGSLLQSELRTIHCTSHGINLRLQLTFVGTGHYAWVIQHIFVDK